MRNGKRFGFLFVMVLMAGALLARAGAPPASAQTATQLVSGAYHTCALITGGAVQCWGRNGNGQLGNNSTAQSPKPVAVRGLDGGVAAIAAGLGHTCALMATSRAVQCWGENVYGQLGNNSTTAQSLTPVPVSGLGSGVTAIAAGQRHTCALITGGAVRCWGENVYGQLGDGTSTHRLGDTTTTSRRLTPVTVTGLVSGVAAIAAGGNYTCARITAGGVQCWGRNDFGELGDGTTTHRRTPVAVSALGGGAGDRDEDGQVTGAQRPTLVADLAAGGNHTCALTTGGAVQCWGFNQFGQLGYGATERPRPVAVSGVAAIVAGDAHTCARTTNGAVQCWGNNGFGQLGNGLTSQSPTPVPVAVAVSGVMAIAAGSFNTCALITGGAVRCWGENGNGQLGNNTTTQSPTPVAVIDLGSPAAAPTPVATLTPAATPTPVPAPPAATPTLVPAPPAATPTPVTLAAGFAHTCALTTGGAVQCWGRNSRGQLGDGTTTRSQTPVAVSGLGSGVTAITAGFDHTCALIGEVVQCWGYNGFGQLGDNSTTQSPTPVAVSGLGSGVTAIAAGKSHTCALTTGGAVLCWGANGSGQLGDDNITPQFTPTPAPVAVSGLGSGVVAIAAGGDHTCALTTGGAVQCWGLNYKGQLGDDTTDDGHTPVAVSGLGSGVVAIAAGALHTCARTTSGAVQCWGDNEFGQLGNGLTSRSPTPAPVAVVGLGGDGGSGDTNGGE